MSLLSPARSRLLRRISTLLFAAWFVCLPLVGRAGANSPQARPNLIASAALLSIALLLALPSLTRPSPHPASRLLALAEALCLLLLLLGAFRL